MAYTIGEIGFAKNVIQSGGRSDDYRHFHCLRHLLVHSLCLFITSRISVSSLRVSPSLAKECDRGISCQESHTLHCLALMFVLWSVFYTSSLTLNHPQISNLHSGWGWFSFQTSAQSSTSSLLLYVLGSSSFLIPLLLAKEWYRGIYHPQGSGCLQTCFISFAQQVFVDEILVVECVPQIYFIFSLLSAEILGITGEGCKWIPPTAGFSIILFSLEDRQQ